MVRAREIARSGNRLSWTDVIGQLSTDGQATMEMWATPRDLDQIDKLCDEAQRQRRATFMR